MRKRTIVVWLCAIIVTASLAAGCGQKAEGSSQKTTAAQDADVSKAGTESPVPGFLEGAQIVRVTEITENTITAEKGTFERPSPPDIPEDRKGDGSEKGSRPGESGVPDEGGRQRPKDGDFDEGGGQRPKDGDFGGFGGGSFESSGETVTFQVLDSTEILLGSPWESKQGTIEDISVGSVLEIVLDSQDRAEQILINNVMTEDGKPREAMEETEL